MAPRLRDSGDPAEWLRHARSNLSRCRADRRLPDVLFEDLCFDAQQAAEKAIKAVLVSREGASRRPTISPSCCDLVAATGSRCRPRSSGEAAHSLRRRGTISGGQRGCERRGLPGGAGDGREGLRLGREARDRTGRQVACPARDGAPGSSRGRPEKAHDPAGSRDGPNDTQGYGGRFGGDYSKNGTSFTAYFRSASSLISTPMPGLSRSGMWPSAVSIGPSNVTISSNILSVWK